MFFIILLQLEVLGAEGLDGEVEVVLYVVPPATIPGSLVSYPGHNSRPPRDVAGGEATIEWKPLYPSLSWQLGCHFTDVVLPHVVHQLGEVVARNVRLQSPGSVGVAKDESEIGNFVQHCSIVNGVLRSLVNPPVYADLQKEILRCLLYLFTNIIFTGLPLSC